MDRLERRKVDRLERRKVTEEIYIAHHSARVPYMCRGIQTHKWMHSYVAEARDNIRCDPLFGIT